MSSIPAPGTPGGTTERTLRDETPNGTMEIQEMDAPEQVRAVFKSIGPDVITAIEYLAIAFGSHTAMT